MEDLLVSMKSMQKSWKVLRPRNEDADHWSGHAGSREGCFGKSGGAEVNNIAPMNAHRSFALVTVCSKLHMEHSDTKWQIVELAETW